MKSNLLLAFLILLICLPTLLFAQDSIFSKSKNNILFKTKEPSVKMQEALNLSKDYIRNNKIDTTNKYLDNIRLIKDSNWPEKKYWIISWEDKNNVDGGQIFILIGMDRKIKINYGL